MEIDKNDPNYDPETNDTNVELKEVIAEPSPEEFFKTIEPIVLEYFENGDTHEVAISLDEVLVGSLRPYVITYSVQIALDHKDTQRELISVLISDLYGRVVLAKDIAKGKHYSRHDFRIFSFRFLFWLFFFFFFCDSRLWIAQFGVTLYGLWYAVDSTRWYNLSKMIVRCYSVVE